MAEQESALRDFGILPVALNPPKKPIRSYLSTGKVIGQWIGTGIVKVVH